MRSTDKILHSEIDYQGKVARWLRADAMRMDALRAASCLNLDQWCIAAGFVRNMIWDRLHGYSDDTPLNDIDLIYFDDCCRSQQAETAFQERLKQVSSLPWSVKNQARMHVRNNDQPYGSLRDAMSYWVEIETAVGARLTDTGDIEFIAPWGLRASFANTVTLNTKCNKLEDFERRVTSKRWLENWPNLVVVKGD